jgi:cytosine/adenosine deaminase-related metal-dependent hydrolase
MVVLNGIIDRIEDPAEGPADLALGNVAVLPGFVNTHTHLELGPIAALGEVEDQLGWLERVVAARRETDDAALQAQVGRGIAASLAAGTTTLADITTAGRSEPSLDASPLKGLVFSEILGLRRERALDTSASAYEWLLSPGRAEPGGDVPRIRRGLSPHAPYSTAPWLYEQAAGSRVPLATHLAELPEELELLAGRSGRLREFLERIGAWDPGWRPLSHHPADYIRRRALRQADWIVAHGTYLDPEDFWQFRPEAAPQGQRVGVAYCPRTTARFGHGPHPYRQIIEHGGVVCLGTDSLASAPSLSVLDEIRFLADKEPDGEPRLLLTMGTLSGAWALRMEDRVGSLLPGKAADLAVVALPDRSDTDPYRLIVQGRGPVVGTAIDGEFYVGPLPLG